MRSHLQNVKLGSRGVWSRVLAACAGVVALSGCIIVDSESDRDDTVIVDPGPAPIEPMLMSIETDIALDAVPGDGVGVFVEYYAGGKYRIWTTCDTNFSKAFCPFDIFTSVDSASNIISVGQENLEGFDKFSVNEAAGTVDIRFETDNDFDAVEINVTPGAILRVEAFIDGQARPNFVYWFGNGVLHQGAPTSPVDFVPSKP